MINKDIFGYYRIRVKYSDAELAKMLAWCRDNIQISHSPYTRVWSYEIGIDRASFVFDRESDAIFFDLRWA